MDGIQTVLDTLCNKVDRAQRIGFYALAKRRTKTEVQKDVDEIMVLLQDIDKLLRFGTYEGRKEHDTWKTF